MKKRLIIAPLIVAATLGLAACGAGKVIAPARPAASTAPAAGKSVGVAADSAASRANAAPAAAGSAQQFQPAAELPPIPPIDRMIVKNGSLGLMVDDPESSLSQVDQLIRTEQGVIASQSVRTQNDKTFVNLTIQVPPDNFEDTLAKLRDLRAHGTHVVNDTVSSQDVTAQYIDLDAQYRNLQTTRDAYQKLLDKSTTVSDIVTLTREIANIQTHMDQLKGRENLISRQAAVSTINLSLSPVGASVQPGPKPLLEPALAVQQAWSALLAGLQGMAVVLIWMGILLPIPAAVLVGGWLVYRRVTRIQPGSAG